MEDSRAPLGRRSVAEIGAHERHMGDSLHKRGDDKRPHGGYPPSGARVLRFRRRSVCPKEHGMERSTLGAHERTIEDSFFKA